MSGFLERVIEDWLTRSDERSYQASFVSLLLRSGHTIKYVSKHSSLEFGKDIVSVSPSGELTAYQLKAGDIGLTSWRKMREEVFELSEVRYGSPTGRKRRPQRCFLVTTGTIHDPVQEQLRDHNEENREKNFAPIEVVERPELVRMFMDVFTEFFPKAVGSFNDLVRVYLSDGAGPLDKALFCSVLQGVAPDQNSKTKTSRTLSNLVVAAEFASTPFRLSENHISIMDVWILTACRIVSLARHLGLKPGQWLPPLGLCRNALEASGTELLAELFKRPDYLQGDPLIDTLVVPYRRTIALGYGAAVINAHRILGEEMGQESRELLASLLKHAPLGVWGEGAWNYYANLALAISASPEGVWAARDLTMSWLAGLLSLQIKESPYWTLESQLSAIASDRPEREQKPRESYSLGSATDMLCRRMWRQSLAQIWRKVSKRELADFVPNETEDYFDWFIEEGTTGVRILPIPGSWRELRSASFAQRSDLFTDDDAWLLPLMLCCYPHRVSRRLTGELDYRTASETAKREWHR